MAFATEEKKKVEIQTKKKEQEEQTEETPLILGRVANIKEQIVKIKRPYSRLWQNSFTR